MRPGQLTPNDFEIALLGQLSADNANFRLSPSELHVVSREFTGVGSFTNFLVKGQAKVPRQVFSMSGSVSIPGLKYGLGVVAFYEGDRLTLETYSSGDEHWDGVFDGFAIETAA
jgi:hypothetical protein